MKTILRTRLNKLNFIIVTHVFATGPALDLEEYLYPKANKLLFIGHPFPYRQDKRSFARQYIKGKLIKKNIAIDLRLNDLFFYLRDVFYTFYWILSQKNKYDYYIGSDSFVAFLGLILKRMGKVDNVVLYTIDYVKKRFDSSILNRIYHYFDRVCLKNCKVVWNLSSKMAEAREEFDGLLRKDCVPQLLVPVGIWHKRIPKLPFSKKKKNQIVFMGHLLEKQGLDVVINSLFKISRTISNVELLVVGGGSYEEKLKLLVKKNKLENIIHFTGYIEDHEEVEKMLAESIVAVAMYKPDPESFTYFADPGKIKNYLSAGLPIVLTDVPPIAKELVEKKCAMVSGYSINEFSSIMINLLKDEKKLKEYSINATKFAQRFDWDQVFSDALAKTI